ncbi:hypothetical protein NMK54_34355 [Nocardia otitidiscaviarum]|uniref:hypothetical protein n=1 Tax=Nocardia otitidiscaviarum TaxID=1823 RepID=UPI0020CCC056|nr:hypothetical protein [Nocardia otitidiscaviarum]MCP9625230.1 hypothetical protein [Nocardia otitidiscaviarum]
MDEGARVTEMWPQPDSVAQRWAAAQTRMLLQLTYGRPSERRRARILAARACRGYAEGIGCGAPLFDG